MMHNKGALGLIPNDMQHMHGDLPHETLELPHKRDVMRHGSKGMPLKIFGLMHKRVILRQFSFVLPHRAECLVERQDRLPQNEPLVRHFTVQMSRKQVGFTRDALARREKGTLMPQNRLHLRAPYRWRSS
ncbi:MAG TPA: hypothetical protein VE685_03945 [Thermoanaerobaculia bacterium]|nr:hypothetical protein [Thermoanaerobaculia bacterium]